MTAWSMAAEYGRVATAASSQWGQGGSNAGYDCVPTCYALAVQLLGGPALSVPAIVLAAYGSAFHGPTTFDVIEAEVRKLWPQLPHVTYGQPDDLLAAIDVAGLASCPVLCTFHATNGGTIDVGGAPSGGPVHVCPVIAHTDREWLQVLNVEHNVTVAMSDDVFRVATGGGAGAGWLAVFDRPRA